MRDEGERQRAMGAALATAATLGLVADEGVVLSDSNRLVVRLLPCDTVARVAPLTHFASAALEVELVHRLGATDSPVAPLDPRVEPRLVVRDGFEIALWAHVRPSAAPPPPPAEYAGALGRLHAGLREVDLATPHVTDRLGAIQRDVADREVTPDLAEADRALLADVLRDRRRSIVDRGAPEQLLHGEPHPWNVLRTEVGPRFIDFENTARGPVEYDLAWVPDEVLRRYADVDRALVDDCRAVVLAIIAAHRWSRDDRHPSGRASGVAFLDALRDGPPWPALDDVTW